MPFCPPRSPPAHRRRAGYSAHGGIRAVPAFAKSWPACARRRYRRHLRAPVPQAGRAPHVLADVVGYHALAAWSFPGETARDLRKIIVPRAIFCYGSALMLQTAQTELCPPDSHHLLAAEGWLELGNAAEAGEEIAR